MDAAKLSIHQSGNQAAALQQKQHQQLQNQLNTQLQQQQHLQHHQQQLPQQQYINLQLQQQQQLQASQQQHVHNGHQQQQMQVQQQPHLSPFNANSASNLSTGGSFGAPNTNNNKNDSNSNLSQAAQQQQITGDGTTEGNKIFDDLINDLQDFNPDFFNALDEILLQDVTTKNDNLDIKSENPMAQVSPTFDRPSNGGPGSAIGGIGGPTRGAGGAASPNGSHNAYRCGFGGPNHFMQGLPQQQHQNSASQLQQKQMQQQQQQQQQQNMSQDKMGVNGPMSLGNFPKPNVPSQQQQSQRQNPAQQLLYPSYNAPMGTSAAGNQSTAGHNFMQGPQQQKQSQQQQPQPANRRVPNPKENTPSMGGGGAQNPCGSNINASPNNGPTSQQSIPDVSQQQTTANTLEMKQTQQLHFIQQDGAHDIPVSAGQHLHQYLSGDIKSNVPVAAEQSMKFSQQQQQNPNAQQGQQQVPANVKQKRNKSPSAASAGNKRAKKPKASSGPGPNNGPYNSSGQRVPDGPNPTGANTGLANLMSGPGGPNSNVADTAASNMRMGGMGLGAARYPHQMTYPHPAITMVVGPDGAPVNISYFNFLQQQEFLRVHTMQQQKSGMAGTRPPLPEYKATQVPLMQAQMVQQIVDGSGRFPNVAEQAVDVRKLTQQPIPPSDTMMRPQHSMSMQHSAAAGPLSAMGVKVAPGGQQKPPKVQATLVGMAMGSQEEWRRTMMPQQQMSFNGVSGGYMRYEPVASNNNGFMGNSHGGPMISGIKPGMQLIPAEMQQQMVRQQQQHVPSQEMMGGSNSSKPNDMLMQQIMQQQSLQQGGPQGQGGPNAMMSQMQMASMRMPQQNVTVQQQQQFVQKPTTTYQQQQQQTLQMSQQGPGNTTTGSSASNGSVLGNSNDLCLELLDILSVDVDNFSTEDLLNLLDNDTVNI